ATINCNPTAHLVRSIRRQEERDYDRQTCRRGSDCCVPHIDVSIVIESHKSMRLRMHLWCLSSQLAKHPDFNVYRLLTSEKIRSIRAGARRGNAANQEKRLDVRGAQTRTSCRPCEWHFHWPNQPNTGWQSPGDSWSALWDILLLSYS